MPVLIHNKEYYTVAERIDLLNGMLGKREMEYSLNTELISWENGVIIMKAILTLINGESVLTYTGHAYEKEDSTQINRTSALENCETSAIGRALSAAGFGGGNEYASANEVQNAVHQQNTVEVIPENETQDKTDHKNHSVEMKAEIMIDLKAANWEKERMRTIGFGKHSDLNWSDTPRGYLEWLYKNANKETYKNRAGFELDYRNINELED